MAAQKERSGSSPQTVTKLASYQWPEVAPSDTSRQYSDRRSHLRRERLADIDRARRAEDAGSVASSLRPVDPAPVITVSQRRGSPPRRPSPRRPGATAAEPEDTQATITISANSRVYGASVIRSRVRQRERQSSQENPRRRSRSGEMRDAL